MYADLEANIVKINDLRFQLQQIDGKAPSRRTLMGIFGLMTHSLHHAVNAMIGGDADVNAYADSDIGVGPAAKTRTFEDIKPHGSGGSHLRVHGSAHGEVRGGLEGRGYEDTYDDGYYDELDGRGYVRGDGYIARDRYSYADRLRPRYDYEYGYERDRGRGGLLASGHNRGRGDPQKVENKIIIQHAERKP
jgi:hypothetical protein